MEHPPFQDVFLIEKIEIFQLNILAYRKVSKNYRVFAAILKRSKNSNVMRMFFAPKRLPWPG